MPVQPTAPIPWPGGDVRARADPQVAEVVVDGLHPVAVVDADRRSRRRCCASRTRSRCRTARPRPCDPYGAAMSSARWPAWKYWLIEPPGTGQTRRPAAGAAGDTRDAYGRGRTAATLADAVRRGERGGVRVDGDRRRQRRRRGERRVRRRAAIERLGHVRGKRAQAVDRAGGVGRRTATWHGRSRRSTGSRSRNARRRRRPAIVLACGAGRGRDRDQADDGEVGNYPGRQRAIGEAAVKPSQIRQ